MDETGSCVDISIRRYDEETDYEEVFNIENTRLKEDYSVSVFLRQASILHPSTFLVAEMNGRIVGYTIGAFIHENPGTAWVIRLAVLPEFRRKGIGKKLFNALISCLVSNGVKEIMLTVSPDNTPARLIYQEHGFHTVREIKDYFGEGKDRLIKRYLLNNNRDL